MLKRIMLALSLLAALAAVAVAAEDLPKNFATPPDSARPWVYWFWLNQNITKEGITADLEAMRRVGIGGVLIMEVDQGAPLGPVPFAGPKWRELFKHVCAEAARLGLEVNMNNDAGWCGSGGPWITPEAAQQHLVWTETAVEGPRHFDAPLPRPRIHPAAAGYYQDIAVLAFPTPKGKFEIKDIKGQAAQDRQEFPPPPAAVTVVPAEWTVPSAGIRDLTGQLKDGRLSWDVPAGKWTVLRLGHTPTGKDNHPAPESGRGLECDKLNAAGADTMFAGLMAKLTADVGPLAGKTLVSTHIDSWEVGSQNWTRGFRQEFQKRRGYDPLLYLPAMTGQVVDSLDASERFLWDLRQTVSDMLVENYAGRFRELARQHGIRLSIEAYDGCPCDDVAYAGQCDEPMAEFWRWGYSTPYSCVEMSSAAHVYGKRILGAEAFTSTGVERWLSHPATIKTLGDWALCEGINRFVFHRYAMQPWLDRKPGMSMGPWGLHYERTQTWWEQSRAWHQYLARCQYLLRQGLFVADICYLQPEGSPRRFTPPMPREGNEPDRPGYNFDGCTADVVFHRMSVKDGRIVLPDGMNYRLLALPEAQTMTPRLLARIADLVEAGATVVGPRPWRSPSLTGYPQCDDEVKKIADRLWGDCDGKQVKEHRLGQGHVVWGQTPEQVLAGMKLMPDFSPTLGTSPVRFIHRRTEDGTELYFVANKTDTPQELACKFRVQGKRPELWRPESGRVEAAAVCRPTDDGRTEVALRLEPAESVFVVFRAPWEGLDPVVTITCDGQPVVSDKPTVAERTACLGSHDGRLLLEGWKNGQYALKTATGKTMACTIADLPAACEITGPWNLSFPPKTGAPENVILDKLLSWSEHGDKGVRYFSGTATYRKTFDVPPGLIAKERAIDLDLGKVEVMAEVKLNGHDLGILWKPPYRLAITGLVNPGANELEVKVTNLWINRMIGDEQLPEDSDRNADGSLKKWPQWLDQDKPSPTGRITFTSWRLWKKDSPLQPSGLLGPVKVLAAEVKEVK